ncbi:MAG TPA: hypothetical protein VF339_15515 [Gammaproteobacteria bacterium]
MQDRTNPLAACARGRLLAVVIVAAAASACSPPPPRSYDFFLNDSIARDGTLARCDRDPVAAQTDIECANARRAALAVLLEEERARREALERESQAKIEALRREFEARQAREAAEAAEAEQALAGFGEDVGAGTEPVDALDVTDAGAAAAAPDGFEPAASADEAVAAAAPDGTPEPATAEHRAEPAAAIPRAFRADP